MEGLFTIERVVLESLSREPRSLENLTFDTSIDPLLLGKILISLIKKEVIIERKKIFSLNLEKQDVWMSRINNDESVQAELNELFLHIVDSYFDSNVDRKELTIFRVQKFWMNESEERIYNSLLYNLQSFIEGLKRDKRDKGEQGKTFQQKIAFWGHTPYKKLISRQAIGMTH